MHISGEEAAVINIAIGAGLAWGASAVNQRRVRRDALASVRREAYAMFILALDHLERAWTAPETLENEYGSWNMGQVTGQAVREIQRGYVTVILIGSKRAKDAAREARQAAWVLNDHFCGIERKDPSKPNLGTVFDDFSAASRKFVEVGEEEASG